MKGMYRPVATNGMVDNGFFFGSLPKFNAADTDYSVKLLAMRVAGLTGMWLWVH